MISQTIINPEQEFLIIHHSYLNGNTYDLSKSIEETLNLGKYVSGRTIVPCFEGDILDIEETGEVVLTHQNFLPLHLAKYQDLRNCHIASTLDEVLEKVANYKSSNHNQKIVLCFEAKSITSLHAIDNTIKKLQEYNIQDAYFDSFFGEKINDIIISNKTLHTSYNTSLHLIGNLAKIPLMVTRPENNYNILTVPNPLSLGNLAQPVIYGAVTSSETLQKLAHNPLTLGAYVRFKEKNPLIIFFRLFSHFRQVSLANFGIFLA